MRQGMGLDKILDHYGSAGRKLLRRSKLIMLKITYKVRRLFYC
jgi:hypothetical protein